MLLVLVHLMVSALMLLEHLMTSALVLECYQVVLLLPTEAALAGVISRGAEVFRSV